MEHRRLESVIVSDQQIQYRPRTLHSSNTGRSAYLPSFPREALDAVDSLLLANVPANRLGPAELFRRRHEAQSITNPHPYAGSCTLSEADAQALATRLQVNMSIITYNANRLRHISEDLLVRRDEYQRRVLEMTNLGINESRLSSKQMATAVEFFLQMDVDVFYMKTCSFQGAAPRLPIRALFCEENEPEPSYRMSPCRSLFCSCCRPTYTWRAFPRWRVVAFAESPLHRFVNGYTTYLNCPATCDTSNIIYAMTCPCGHYDYVDSTEGTLGSAMAYHREQGNRIIHEMLTGSPLFQGSLLDPDEIKKQRANKMRLYQHSARCPIALRSFLDCNPDYACFIPQRWDAVLPVNMCRFGSATDADPTIVPFLTTAGVDDQRVARHLDLVPAPPTTYAFSYQQIKNQRTFFEQFPTSSMQDLPYYELDLYRMTIIAVLPDDGSALLRYIIETLFIIHGETKLNMICPLGGDPEQRYGRAYSSNWCANVHHRT